MNILNAFVAEHSRRSSINWKGILDVIAKRRTVIAGLLVCWGALLSLSIGQDLLLYSTGHAGISDKIWRFDVDVEQSVYTWFSTCLLLVAGLLLFAVASEKAERNELLIPHWLALSAIFVLLSLDEMLGLHELASSLLAARIDNTGLLFFAWAGPALVLCALGALAYIPFIMSFPPMQRALLLLSGAVFVAGAIGMEMVAGAYVEEAGIMTLTYRFLTTVEEGLEGLGIILFLYTIALHRAGMARQAASVRAP